MRSLFSHLAQPLFISRFFCLQNMLLFTIHPRRLAAVYTILIIMLGYTCSFLAFSESVKLFSDLLFENRPSILYRRAPPATVSENPHVPSIGQPNHPPSEPSDTVDAVATEYEMKLSPSKTMELAAYGLLDFSKHAAKSSFVPKISQDEDTALSQLGMLLCI